MNDNTDARYEEVQEEYRRLINAYGDALTANDPIAAELFVQATAVWARLREFGRDEAEVPNGHFVLAFSFAIGARNEVEAKRIYDTMSDDYRASVDGVEGLEPGSMKIWLRK